MVAALATAGCSSERSPSALPQSASAPSPTGSPSSRVTQATYLGRSVPVRLLIPAILVDTTLMELGLKADGSMQVPPSGFPAGWYAGAPTPGELGPAVIVGHVDWKGPGVFFDVHKLKPGDRVSITRKDGNTPVFRVTRVQEYPKDQFPTTAVYGNIDHAGLRLITCGGTFNPRTRHYEDNIVVFADLVAPVP
ncbi:MAG: class F sortase [Dermatophilaceae bacterium]